MPGPAPIRILLVSDLPEVRRDLRLALLLAGEAAGLPVVVVGEAGGSQGAVQQTSDLQPQVILLDLQSALSEGCTASDIREVSPSSRIIALTVHSRTAWKDEAARLGLDGFIVKGAPLTELLQLISQVTGRPLPGKLA